MVLEPGDGDLGQNPKQHMIETHEQIQKATSAWWRWLAWLPKSRRIARELAKQVVDANGWQIDKIELNAELAVRNRELSHLSEKYARLEKQSTADREAVLHLSRWIQTTHRTQPAPLPNTIKSLLFNAQTKK